MTASAATPRPSITALTIPAAAIAVRQDGGYYTAGAVADTSSHTRIVVASYRADGTLDTGFGTGGSTVTDPSPMTNSVSSLAIAADGKIVLGGNANFDAQSARGGDLLFERFNSGGSLDTTFGQNGIVITNLCVRCGFNDRVTGLALQPDGKVVASAYSIRGAGDTRFTVVRYTAKGRLDPTFGKGGVIDTAPNGAYSVALQPDGKILAGGNDGLSVELFRYMPDGTPDATFGVAGKVVTPFQNPPTGEVQGNAISINLLSDGRFVVGAPFVRTTVSYQWAALRYLANGSIDRSFGTGGLALAPVASPQTLPERTLLLPNGDLLIAGTYDYSNPINPALNERVFVSRLGADGKLDTTFGTGGTLVTALQRGVRHSLVSLGGFALLPNGTLIATANSINPNTGASGSYLIRYR